MNSNLHVVATLVARNGHEAELRDALKPAIPLFRAEPGCKAYVLLEDREQAGRFMTYETWSDEDALAAHMKSPTMKSLAPQMKELLQGEIKQDLLSVLVGI